MKFNNSLFQSKRIFFLFICVIFVFGVLLRTFWLHANPPALNRDELSIAYNAYSLVQTGYDEHGQGPFPFNFQAFGDYKLPGLIYITALGIKLFGSSVFAVRLFHALIASLLIPSVAFLAYELFHSKKISVLSALFSCCAFWSIHGARSLFEPATAAPFTIFAIASFLRARKNSIWFLFAAISCVFAFVLYNSPLIVLPFIFLSGFFVFHKDFFSKEKIIYSAIFAVFVFCSIGILWVALRGVNASRSNSIIFFDQTTLFTYNEKRVSLQERLPKIIISLFFNKPEYFGFVFLEKYLSAFHPLFLFVYGDRNPWHNLQAIHFGMMNIVNIPFFIIGIYSLLRKKQNHVLYFFLLLLITPLANGITKDAPVSNRLFEFFSLVEICAAVGATAIISHIRQRRKTILSILGIGAFLLYGTMFLFFLRAYFYEYPISLPQFWFRSSQSIVELVKRYHQPSTMIYMSPEVEFGYIYFAWYMPFEPKDFQQQAQWSSGSFSTVQQYDNFVFLTQLPRFDTVSATEIEKYFPKGIDQIVVIHRGEIPKTHMQRAGFIDARIHNNNTFVDEPGLQPWVVYTMKKQTILNLLKQNNEKN